MVLDRDLKDPPWFNGLIGPIQPGKHYEKPLRVVP